MIIEFKSKQGTEQLLQNYFRQSEAWNREQDRSFWAEEKAKNTDLWKEHGRSYPEGAA